MQGLGFTPMDAILSLPKKVPSSPRTSPVALNNGVRAPDCRVSLSADYAAYLYDSMLGVGKFHILVFASTLQGPVYKKIAHLSKQGFGPGGFFDRFGRHERFNVVLVVKALPHEADELVKGPGMRNLREIATVVFDDRTPDEDAHYCYAVNHARGAMVIVRPDLVVGTSVWPEDAKAVDEYFSSFLIGA